MLLPGSWFAALFAAGSFAFCPQYLFVSATLNCDGALAALTSLCFWGLLRLHGRSVPSGESLGNGDGGSWMSRRVSLWAALSVGCKSTAIVLWPALACTAWKAWMRRRRVEAAVLVLLPALAACILAAVDFQRFGVFWQSPPIMVQGPLSARLAELAHPWWIVRLRGSFWANLGWLSVRLPLCLYAVFVPPTLLVVWGLNASLRRRRFPAGGLSGIASRMAVLTLATNVLLLLVYMVRIDWQPQGRYFFPSLAPLVVLCAIGIQDLRIRLPRLGRRLHQPWVMVPALILSYCVTLFSVFWAAARLGAA